MTRNFVQEVELKYARTIYKRQMATATVRSPFQILRSVGGDASGDDAGSQLALLLLRADQHPRHEVVRHHAERWNQGPLLRLRSCELISL